MSAPNPIDEAIRLLGSEAKLAKAVGCSQPAINKAKRTARVSAKLAAGIDAATSGQISKSLLRPDLWPLEQPTTGGEGL